MNEPSRERWADWASPWTATLALALFAFTARVVYLLWLCPYTLIEDEAHYWEWSRRLALSYYTKGPGVAWTIAASTHLLGTSAAAVRLPAAISSLVAGLFLAALARRMSGDGRTGFFVLACFLLAPAFQILGLTMTIDGPYLACWAAALWAGWIAIREHRPWAWALLGVALGVGFLYKYTILLALPGVIITAALGRHDTAVGSGTRARRAVGVLVATVLFALCLSPVLIWNEREGWPTVRHLLGHLGVAGGDMPVTQGSPGAGGWHYDPRWTLELIGTQLVMVGPALVLSMMELARAWRTRRDNPARWRGDAFLLAWGLPVLVFYLGVSFVAEPEGNWPLAGVMTLLPLGARRVIEGMTDWTARWRAWKALPEPRPRAGFFVRRPETPTQVLWTMAVVIGLVVAITVPRLDLLARLPGLGRYVPIHRFSGADVMAGHVERLLASLRAGPGAREPFVMATHYGRASQLAFYLPGRPVVYCTSSRMREGRATQYDYWTDTSPDDPALLGRDAIVVGSTLEEWSIAFDRVELVGTLEGDGKRNRPAFKAWGYRGFPRAARPAAATDKRP